MIEYWDMSMNIYVHDFTFSGCFGYTFSKQKIIEIGIHRALKTLEQSWLLFFVFLLLYVEIGIKSHHINLTCCMSILGLSVKVIGLVDIYISTQTVFDCLLNTCFYY